MPAEITEVPQGTVTSPQGFLAGATYAGIRTYSEDKVDFGMLMSEKSSMAAGMFTTNLIRSPSVVVTEEHIANGTAQVIVINSGIANACVGEQGYKDAKECTAMAAEHLGIPQEDVLFCSTGLIGVELPMGLLKGAIPKVNLAPDGGHPLARAILTTDLRPKEYAVSFPHDGRTVTIGGITKGSGMIHPNMATTLTFLTTDAAVEPAFFKEVLRETVDSTLNMVSVDGDMSTNDSVIILANGAAGGEVISWDSDGAETYQRALMQVCAHLSREIARDGEGATKVITVIVEGARTLVDARKAAKAVATSSLVKTAVTGNDPNWGRILASVGASGAEVVEEKIALYINDVCIMEDGRPVPFFKDAVVAIMREQDVSFRISLGLGDASAQAWGCDLTNEYVTINSAYTT
ncbi:MAG: glutamate N-acetyltransferase / amino-acid N-acetyltransferase [Chloroflexi bacterium]|nr:MAG: glutamate N-acetyltransferase / amino-acid N-acetyltransferase [Chloroflexota bacterium]